jgi:hypothetical protein
MLRASAATSSKKENWTDSQNFNICNHNYKATSLQYYNLCNKLDNSREEKHLKLADANSSNSITICCP